MSRLNRYIPVLGASIALGVGGAGASALARGTAHASRAYSAWDQQWLQTSIEGDLFEIAGGTVAQQKGSTAAVKAYGLRLVTDHTKSLKDATKLARALGIKVPKAPSPSQQWELQTVAGFSGAQFDANYADLEAKDHQQDISEAKDEVKDGTNASLRHDAKTELPTLKQHLKIAEQLGGKLGKDPLS
jgi:putative membrane protein